MRLVPPRRPIVSHLPLPLTTCHRRDSHGKRLIMTTTTAAQPVPARLAWVPLIWIGTFAPPCPSCVCSGLFFLVWRGRLHLPALADRRDRDLPDLSSPAHASQFCPAAALARVLVDDRGSLASEGGAIGWIADHRKHHAHSDEEDDTPHAACRASSGRTCAGG